MTRSKVQSRGLPTHGLWTWTFDFRLCHDSGIGIDIIEVARIQASYEKFGERFLNRILHPNEISYCLSYKAPAPFLAVRFAAKEAISKAFGTGIGAQLGWQDMEVDAKRAASRLSSCTRRAEAAGGPRGAGAC